MFTQRHLILPRYMHELVPGPKCREWGWETFVNCEKWLWVEHGYVCLKPYLYRRIENSQRDDLQEKNPSRVGKTQSVQRGVTHLSNAQAVKARPVLI